MKPGKQLWIISCINFPISYSALDILQIQPIERLWSTTNTYSLSNGYEVLPHEVTTLQELYPRSRLHSGDEDRLKRSRLFVISWVRTHQKLLAQLRSSWTYKHQTQGRNEGRIIPRDPNHCEGAEWLLGRRITAGTPKSSHNITIAFFNTVHLLPKDLRFGHGSAKCASCPERHLTSLSPWSYNEAFILKEKRLAL